MSEAVLTPTEHWNTGSGAKAYSVSIDGLVIGVVEQTFPTFDRKPPGARIVTKRWTTKKARWGWRCARTARGSGRLWRETRKQAVADLIREWERPE